MELNPFLILSCLSRGFLAAGTETIRERNKKYPGHIYLNKSDPVSLHSFLFLISSRRSDEVFNTFIDTHREALILSSLTQEVQN